MFGIAAGFDCSPGGEMRGLLPLLLCKQLPRLPPRGTPMATTTTSMLPYKSLSFASPLQYTFAPKEEAIRAQIAALLQGYLMQKETTAAQDIALTVAGKQLAVEWADNSTVDALRELLLPPRLPMP